MSMSLHEQLTSFFLVLIIGSATGLIYDVYRFIERKLKLKKWVLWLGDVTFWFVLTVIVFIMLFMFHDGEIRFYVFYGILAGLILYRGLRRIIKMFLKSRTS